MSLFLKNNIDGNSIEFNTLDEDNEILIQQDDCISNVNFFLEKKDIQCVIDFLKSQLECNGK